MKVAIYARVSTTKQDNENQLAQLREFAGKQSWELFDNYIDQESGSTADRPEFQRMFADASKRKFDVLLFWALDRLSREGVLETLQHLNRLTSYGLGYRSFTEQYFDSCGIFKDAVISILATIARQERIRISERVRAGLQRAQGRGRRLGRPRKIVDAARIGALRDQGLSWREIVAETGISKGSAQRAVRGLPKIV